MNEKFFLTDKRKPANVLLCIEKTEKIEKFSIFSNRRKCFEYLLTNCTENEMVYCRKVGLSFSKPLQFYTMFYKLVRPGCFSFYRACRGKSYTTFTIHILKMQ